MGSVPDREPEDHRHSSDLYDGDEAYYLPDDMADKTIEWLHGIRAQDAGKPFFGYFSTRCNHAPHHVAEAWAKKYRASSGQGWDKLREETFARQKALGVIPPTRSSRPATRLSPPGMTSRTS